MLGTLVRWLILTLAVWVSAYVVLGIAYDHWQNLLIAALVLGILNAFVKPILLLISLPLIFVTFGFFLVLINALLLMATSWLVPGLHVASFWSALGGSLVVSIVGLFFGYSRIRSSTRNSGVGFDKSGFDA